MKHSSRVSRSGRGSGRAFRASTPAAALLFGAILLGGTVVALGHALAPAVLELHELAGGRVDVSWKLPLPVARGATARPVLPAWCSAIGEPTLTVEDASIRQRWSVDCGTRGLGGGIVGVDGLETTGADAFIRIARHDGELVRGLVSPRNPSLQIPVRARGADLVWTYGELGIRHILGGADHLVFLLGLLLLAVSAGRVVETVVAFTVGNSLSLSLAILGAGVVPAKAAELAIALSVFVLAVDLDRAADRQRAALLSRAPWAVAFVLGLLYGLGFAGALRQSGLPLDSLPLSLFAFNAGIELGQIALVLVALAVARTLALLPIALPAWSRRVPIYALGSLAAFWCFERGTALFR